MLFEDSSQKKVNADVEDRHLGRITLLSARLALRCVDLANRGSSRGMCMYAWHGSKETYYEGCRKCVAPLPATYIWFRNEPLQHISDHCNTGTKPGYKDHQHSSKEHQERIMASD
jgi:hypothetical protein